MMSIGAVKGVGIGSGFAAASSTGSQNNDPFIPIAEEAGHSKPSAGIAAKATNHAGGILGGISDGSDILFSVAFKPTPSIGQAQQTVNTEGEAVSLAVKGRHDPLIMPRAVPVVSAMAALVLADTLMLNACSRMDSLMKIYGARD